MVQYRQLAFLKKFSEMHSWPEHFNNIATVKSEYRFSPPFFILGDNFATRLFTRLLQGCLQGCCKVVTRLLQGCYKVVARLLQDCCCVNCILVTRLLQPCVFYMGIYIPTPR